jgi:hypothetical protein
MKLLSLDLLEKRKKEMPPINWKGGSCYLVFEFLKKL